MSDDKKPWWYPVPTDAAYCARLRHDYPEHAAWSDEELIEHYNDGRKYQFLADHVGDAYEQFEALADDYTALRAQRDALAAGLKIAFDFIDYATYEDSSNRREVGIQEGYDLHAPGSPVSAAQLKQARDALAALSSPPPSDGA